MNTTPEFGATPTAEQRAGEYVLGLMRGTERAQFETEMARDPELAQAVAFWEDKLAPLAWDAATETMPATALWRSIEAAIKPAPPRQPSPWFAALWNNLGLWRGIGAIAVAAAIILALINPLANHSRQISMVALLNQGAKPLFTVALRTDGGGQILPLTHAAPPAGKVWELWAVAKGAKPVPIGFLQSGPTELRAGDIPAAFRKPGVLIAVTVEQPGGSPTGTPTLPIMFDGPLNSIKG